MPLKLKQCRKDKNSPYYYVRGTYLGIAVDRSTKATDRRIARAILNRWRSEIERGEYRDQLVVKTAPVTFRTAAAAYMNAGGERKYLETILEMKGEHALQDRLLTDIDQLAIDNAAVSLYPNVSAATRNRQFYTPATAVLRHGGIEKRFKRPKNWRGNKSTSWLEPEQAFRLFREADRIEPEFGLFLRVLTYTGMRLNDALGVRVGQCNLKLGFIYLPKTKNSEPRAVFLPETLVSAFEKQPPSRARQVDVNQVDTPIAFLNRHDRAKLFRFHAGGRLRNMLKEAMERAGLSFPRREGGFHLFCHTYGTWMHRYGGLDNFGLTRTDRWKDPRSADRYRHTYLSEESRRAALLPVERQA
jgi:integrase